MVNFKMKCLEVTTYAKTPMKYVKVLSFGMLE